MFIDSHTHLDHIYNNHPDRIEWLKKGGCIPISWSFGLDIENKNDLKNYLLTQSETIQMLNKQDLTCYFLSGIHPRNITPDLKPEDIETLLVPFLENPLCLGLGEVGLEYGDGREIEILRAQLSLGNRIVSMNKVIGIHTPRNNKCEVARQLLLILKDFPDITDFSIIDHCTPEIIGDVLGKGFHAGISLSPVKSSLDELKEMTEKFPDSIDNIICNTDSGTSFYESFCEFITSKTFPEKLKRRLTLTNAQSFFLKNG